MTAATQSLDPNANARARRRARTRRKAVTVARYAAAGLMLVWILAPLSALFLVSVQSRADSLEVPPDFLPVPDLSNYTSILERAFSSGPASAASDLIVPGIVNSAIVATATALVCLVLGSAAGYAFARFRFPGRTTIPLTLLGSQMVPAFALIVPFYIVLRSFGLTNTRTGVAIALLSITLPFTIWLMRSYFLNVSVEIERAARIDGLGRMATFVRVVLPLARPGLICAGLFAFMIAWNDFLFAVVLNSNVDQTLVQPAIAGLYNVREQSFGLMAAGSLLAALPTMLIALFIQRYLVQGLLSGVGKG